MKKTIILIMILLMTTTVLAAPQKTYEVDFNGRIMTLPCPSFLGMSKISNNPNNPNYREIINFDPNCLPFNP